MKKLKKKQPDDYPIFSFRISKEDKEDLIKKLDDAKMKLNHGIGEDERVVTKNDILIEAIKLGLTLVKRK